MSENYDISFSDLSLDVADFFTRSECVYIQLCDGYFENLLPSHPIWISNRFQKNLKEYKWRIPIM